MNAMAAKLSAGDRNLEEIIALAEQELNDKGFRADDIQIRDADTLLELAQTSKRAVILMAAWLGQARLIDNKVVDLPRRQGLKNGQYWPVIGLVWRCRRAGKVWPGSQMPPGDIPVFRYAIKGRSYDSHYAARQAPPRQSDTGRPAL
jgi:hypothetical protein